MKSVAMKRVAGFTLLEVLASLVLLALLLIGVYSGLRTATRSVRSGTAGIERIVAGNDAEHQCVVGDRARHRPDMIECEGKREDAAT